MTIDGIKKQCYQLADKGIVDEQEIDNAFAKFADFVRSSDGYKGDVPIEKSCIRVRRELRRIACGSGKNTTMIEVIRIVEPFIAGTMETIPPSALVRLINLLAKDKLIDLAENYGINLSEISVTSE